MRDNGRLIHFHLQVLQKELQRAEYHVVQGKQIVEQQRKRIEKLRSVCGHSTRSTQNADTFLRMLEDTQRILESHVDLLKHEIATET
jgi:hypothetical protein